MITDGNGIPLAVSLTGGNRNDVTQLMPLLEAIPPVRGEGASPANARTGCTPTGPTTTIATAVRCARNAITPVIARRGTAHGSGLGVHRWVVEQTIALLHWFRRLRIRWEIRDDIHGVCGALAPPPADWLTRGLSATSGSGRLPRPRRRGIKGCVSRANPWRVIRPLSPSASIKELYP